MSKVRCIAGIVMLSMLVAVEAGAQIQFGVQLGANRSTISSAEFDDEDEVSKTGRIGFQGGVVATFGTGSVALMPGLVFTQKGVKYTFDEEGVSGSVSQHLNYLQVPLLVRVQPGGGGASGPFFYAGPAIAMEMGCTVSFSAAGFSDSDDCGDDDDRSKSDLSLIAGVGLSFGALSVALQYDHGLTDLSKGESDDPINNRAFSVVARYFFGGR